jgi:hypothetical protein
VNTVDTPTETPAVVNPPHPLAILDVALALRKMVERVTPEEFNWQDAHYDYHSEQSRELLFLIANHEWVRATSEIVDVVRSDVIDTTIKTDIDLSQMPRRSAVSAAVRVPRPGPSPHSPSPGHRPQVRSPARCPTCPSVRAS